VDARGGRWVIGALTLVLVGLLVGIGLLVTSRDSVDEDLTRTHHEIAAAARAEALAFLTVDHEDMDPLVDAVLAGATGRFKEQYESQHERLTREAVRTEATSTAEVVALGVGGFTEDSGSVLIAANSTIANTTCTTDRMITPRTVSNSVARRFAGVIDVIARTRLRGLLSTDAGFRRS
jgi:Mce-associated membrane protein